MNDKEFIQNSNDWPNWPVLPVKRSNSKVVFGIECGIILDSNKNEVIHHSITTGITSESLHKAPVHSYENLDALLSDGWVVD